MRIKELIEHAIDDCEKFEKIEEITEIIDELNSHDKIRIIGEFKKYRDLLKQDAISDDICPDCGADLVDDGGADYFDYPTRLFCEKCGWGIDI